MSECLGCQRLEDESVPLKQLSSGQKVCNYCPEWLLETEAKEFLAKPLKDRQRALNAYAELNPKHVTQLKERMALIFSHRKSLQKGQPVL